MTDPCLLGFWFAVCIVVACLPAIVLKALSDWQAWRNRNRRERMR